MKDAIIVNEQDIKRILSLHFNVEEKDIIKTKYSFVVTNINKETESSKTC